MIIELKKPIETHSQVSVQLPNEVLTLLRDLHEDRQSIGVGGCILVVCAVLLTLKHLFKRG